MLAERQQMVSAETVKSCAFVSVHAHSDLWKHPLGETLGVVFPRVEWQPLVQTSTQILKAGNADV